MRTRTLFESCLINSECAIGSLRFANRSICGRERHSNYIYRTAAIGGQRASGQQRQLGVFAEAIGQVPVPAPVPVPSGRRSHRRAGANGQLAEMRSTQEWSGVKRSEAIDTSALDAPSAE